MQIREGGLDDPRVTALLRMHLDDVRANPTPGGAHVLDVAGLKKPGVAFWTAWRGEDLLGCAALKEVEPGHGEIKSMRTVPDQVRRGAGSALMVHILSEARARGYRRLSLETGATPAFEAAQALYRHFGFTPANPFGEYKPDPLSIFMSRVI
ncbi:GNAT family N-acetyltransferase [Sphingomonas canadensis]|uniref:GNAT family N-acetyltransferase n=1 Tax=Sphingomonas canadensis TaxID=1219257 RepID=A0ABW3H9C4_9SPHN|nr:GNAT family N-acetyltransferase [Sphingomonas canadensis]MCW3837507.1 GNAT family N-acetyltransferase [Sphingomonas canadensis]